MEDKNLFQKFLQFLWPEQKFPPENEVNNSKPIDLLTIDPGVRQLVGWLRKNGFHTTDSGDGKSKLNATLTEADGITPCSHVVITVPSSKLISEANRLHDLLQTEHKIKIYPKQLEANKKPELDVSYCVVNDLGLMILLNVNDEMLNMKEQI